MVKGCRCAKSLCDHDLTFDPVQVTLSLKSCLGCVSETVRNRKLMLGRDIGIKLPVCHGIPLI